MSFKFERVEIKGNMILCDIVYDDGYEQSLSLLMVDSINDIDDLPCYLYYLEDLSTGLDGNILDWLDVGSDFGDETQFKWLEIARNNPPLTHPAYNPINSVPGCG